MAREAPRGVSDANVQGHRRLVTRVSPTRGQGGPSRDPEWYDRVAMRLDPSILQAPAPGESDPLMDALRGDVRGDEHALFLGYYTEAGLARALETYGFLDLLRQRGFPLLRVRVEPLADSQPRLRIYGGDKESDLQVVLDLQARSGRWKPEDGDSADVHEVLFIDWLTLRDARRAFTPERPRLPGQDAPGLGVGWDVLMLLHQAAKRLGRDALVVWPDHLHNAALYGRHFRYHDPKQEGKLRALMDAVGGHPLAHASWAVEWGCLRDAHTGAPQTWPAFRGAQVLPLAGPLRARFRDPAYQRAAEAAHARASYAFDWRAFDARREEGRAKGEPGP